MREAVSYRDDSDDEGDQVTASTVTDRYTATPEAAWQLVGDFAGIGDVFDGVDDVVVVDDVRTFNLMGMRLTERLVSRDEAARTITYSIIDGVPIEAPRGDDPRRSPRAGCEIEWSVTSDPEAAQPLFADAYRGALGRAPREARQAVATTRPLGTGPRVPAWQGRASRATTACGSTRGTSPTPTRVERARRGAQIAGVLTRHLGPVVADEAVHRRHGADGHRRSPRARCASRSRTLGGTFVKFGQLVASSPGLFGEDLAEEFRSCLDTGPSVPYDAGRRALEDELGMRVDEAFAWFDPVPDRPGLDRRRAPSAAP